GPGAGSAPRGRPRHPEGPAPRALASRRPRRPRDAAGQRSLPGDRGQAPLWAPRRHPRVPIACGRSGPMRIVYSHAGKESSFDSDRPRVLIGRSKAGVEIHLDLTPDKTVSRPHAVLTSEGSRYWIEDLNSTRGTLV